MCCAHFGRSDELAHSSLRMTIGRWTTEAEIDYAIDTIRDNVAKLRELSAAVGDVQRRRCPHPVGSASVCCASGSGPHIKGVNHGIFRKSG
jgi:hypothetical protein